MDKEKRIRQLNELAIKGEAIGRLRELDEWGAVVDAIMQEVESKIEQILDPETSSQRYYELRAEINSYRRLINLMDAKQAKGRVAAKQKVQLQEG